MKRELEVTHADAQPIGYGAMTIRVYAGRTHKRMPTLKAMEVLHLSMHNDTVKS
jgi:hypothetical protein